MTFETFATEELFLVAKKLADAADERIRMAALAAADAARAEGESRLAEARAQAEEARTCAETQAADAIAAARSQAEHAAREALSQDGGAAERLLEESAQELARVRAEADAAFEASELAHATELSAVRADTDMELARMRVKTEAEVADVRAAAESEIRSLHAAVDAAARTNAAFGTTIEKLRGDQSQLAADNERLAAEHAALSYERADLLERAQASLRGPTLAALRHAFHSIAAATTAADLLAAASVGLGQNETRGGMFAVRDNAVVFLDAGGSIAWNDDSEPAHLVELLRTHASMRLERVAMAEKAIAELEAYAQMLLDEVEYVYESDASAGKPDAERLDRLVENLRCARQIFQQRVTLEGPATRTLLDDELQRTRERKAMQPFGRDLALALTTRFPGVQPQARAS